MNICYRLKKKKKKKRYALSDVESNAREPYTKINISHQNTMITTFVKRFGAKIQTKDNDIECCNLNDEKQRKRVSFLCRKTIKLLTQFLLSMMLIFYLNEYGKDLIVKLIVQLSIGTNTNIVFSNWYYDYLQPDEMLKRCQIITHHQTGRHFKGKFLTPSKCKNMQQESLKIPKIIHQTYTSFDTIPKRWNNTANEWQKHHPDWQYMFWSDAEAEAFMNTYYKQYNERILEHYQHKISKVDAWRYFILYHYGGVYADMDIVPTQNIEPLLSNHDNILVETPNVGLTNGLMIAKQHSQLMLSVMQHLEEYQNHNLWYWYIVPSHGKVLFSAGPTMFWCATMRYIRAHDTDTRESIAIMDNSIFNKPGDCDCLDALDKYQNTAYFHHSKGLTWHLAHSKLISVYLHCHPILIFGGIMVCCFFLYRSTQLLKQCNVPLRKQLIYLMSGIFVCAALCVMYVMQRRSISETLSVDVQVH